MKDFSDYQEASRRTQSPETRLQGWVLGLCGETGELCDVVKKHTEHGVIDFKGSSYTEKVIDEAGDILFYCTAIFSSLGVTATASFDDLSGMGEFYIDENDDAQSLVLQLFQNVSVIVSSLLEDKSENMEEFLSHVIGLVAAVCHYHGADLGSVAQGNVEKLRKRYPDGFVLGGGVR